MKKKDKLVSVYFTLMAYTSILILALICYFIFKNGILGIKEVGLIEFLTTNDWYPEENIYGILPMIITSFYTIILSISIAIPLGVLTSVYITFFSKNKLKNFLMFIIEIGAAIPSIVYGLFGLVVFVPLVRNITGYQGQSIFVAAIVLSIMVLPTIITISVASLEQVDPSYYQASRALGADKEISIFFIVLKAAKSGIISSIILAISRALGETMAVLMLIGNQARITFNIFKGARVLTTNIVLEMSYAQGLHKNMLISTALILFIFILIINFIFHKVLERKARQ